MLTLTNTYTPHTVIYYPVFCGEGVHRHERVLHHQGQTTHHFQQMNNVVEQTHPSEQTFMHGPFMKAKQV